MAESLSWNPDHTRAIGKLSHCALNFYPSIQLTSPPLPLMKIVLSLLVLARCCCTCAACFWSAAGAAVPTRRHVLVCSTFLWLQRTVEVWFLYSIILPRTRMPIATRDARFNLQNSLCASDYLLTEASSRRVASSADTRRFAASASAFFRNSAIWFLMLVPSLFSYR